MIVAAAWVCSAYGSERFIDCVIKCSDNPHRFHDCTDCCNKQAIAARKACTDACFAPYKKCMEAAEKKCSEMSPVDDPVVKQLCLTQELDKCGGSACATVFA